MFCSWCLTFFLWLGATFAGHGLPNWPAPDLKAQKNSGRPLDKKMVAQGEGLLFPLCLRFPWNRNHIAALNVSKVRGGAGCRKADAVLWPFCLVAMGSRSALCLCSLLGVRPCLFWRRISKFRPPNNESEAVFVKKTAAAFRFHGQERDHFGGRFLVPPYVLKRTCGTILAAAFWFHGRKRDHFSGHNVDGLVFESFSGSALFVRPSPFFCSRSWLPSVFRFLGVAKSVHPQKNHR